MSCRRYRRMLLSRDGESSREEVADLLAHLAGCASCAREAARSSDVEREIRVFRSIPVGASDPARLTHRILRATGYAQQHAGSVRSAWRAGDILDRIVSPAISFASAALLLVVVASALWQCAVVSGEIHQLEARQAFQATTVHPIPAVRYAVDVRKASESLGPGAVQLAQAHGASGIILVSERTLGVVRTEELPAALHLPHANGSLRGKATLRSAVHPFIRPVLSFRIAEGV